MQEREKLGQHHPLLGSTSSNELNKVFLGVLLAEYIAQSKKEVLLFSHQTYQEILDRKA